MEAHLGGTPAVTAREQYAEPDQPPGFPGYGHPWVPPAAEAAERVVEFIKWFGDGMYTDPGDDVPPLFMRDLEALAKAALAAALPDPEQAADLMEGERREVWRDGALWHVGHRP